MLLTTQEFPLSADPDRMIIVVKGMPEKRAKIIAEYAVKECRRQMPKATGESARRLMPLYGPGYFGIYFPDKYVWFQDRGIRAFTMNSLKGKTIPMWVKDTNGDLRTKNPKIKTRSRNGVVEVLIFRKATRPGAPGRISIRKGKDADNPGQIGKGNVGVKWRHPGLAPKQFLNNSLTLAAQRAGILAHVVYVADANWQSQRRTT